VIVGVWDCFATATENVTNLVARLDPLTANVVSNYLLLTDIPRQTYHEKAVSDALVVWAKARGFKPTQDAQNNVWFDVPATAGWEAKPLVILQGHMDMVAVGFGDPQTESVILDCDDAGALFSKGRRTSIGADDGIGVALAMTVADGKVPHGPVRVLVTTDEENTQTGAQAVPSAVLQDAIHLINIDSEDDGELTISSAANDNVTVTGAVSAASAGSSTRSRSSRRRASVATCSLSTSGGADRIGDINAALKAILLANNDDPDAPWISPSAMAGESAGKRCESALRAQGFSKTVAGRLADAQLYGSFRSWAEKKELEPDGLVSKSGIILASAYDAPAVADPMNVTMTVTNLTVGAVSDGGTMAFEIVVEAEGYDPANVDERLLKAALGVEGTADLKSGAFSPDTLDLEFGTFADGRLPVLVVPKKVGAATPGQFFIRTTAE